jgi:hypothetical protein
VPCVTRRDTAQRIQTGGLAEFFNFFAKPRVH